MDLKEWIKQTLSANPEIALKGDLVTTPLSGDAGFRRYYRLNSNTFIAGGYGTGLQRHQ